MVLIYGLKLNNVDTNKHILRGKKGMFVVYMPVIVYISVSIIYILSFCSIAIAPPLMLQSRHMK